MAAYKQAIIESDQRIRCPICGRVNGIANDGAVIRNYIIRCKSSRRNHEHYFILNFNVGKEKKDD